MVEAPSNTLTFPVKDAVDVTVGIRRGGVLLSLLVLPLYIPVLIFGVGAVEAAIDGLTQRPQLLILASNIVKYAGRGTVRVNRVQANDDVDIEVWADDSGPGIADVDRAMRDHFSTGNTDRRHIRCGLNTIWHYSMIRRVQIANFDAMNHKSARTDALNVGAHGYEHGCEISYFRFAGGVVKNSCPFGKNSRCENVLSCTDTRELKCDLSTV